MNAEDFSCFVQEFNVMSAVVHRIATDHGFWEDFTGASDAHGTKIALMHSELSEALEAIRTPIPPLDKHCPQFLSLEVELADCIIRIMDYARRHNLRVAEAIVAKSFVNEARPYKHGKTF